MLIAADGQTVGLSQGEPRNQYVARVNKLLSGHCRSGILGLFIIVVLTPSSSSSSFCFFFLLSDKETRVAPEFSAVRSALLLHCGYDIEDSGNVSNRDAIYVANATLI